MRFMIMVKGGAETEAGTMPTAEQFSEMAAYHEELSRAGVLLDASGLQPSARGWRVVYAGGRRSIVDGPFTEAKELVAGYTLIQARDVEEAREWTRRFPKPMDRDCEIEVRPLYDLDDFGTIGDVERFRALGLISQQKEGSR